MKSRPSAEKRRKEVRRLEKQVDKANRRKLRKEERASGVDPDGLPEDGMVIDADGASAPAVSLEQPLSVVTDRTRVDVLEGRTSK